MNDGTKMKKATRWDSSKHLEVEADIATYLNAALEDDNTSVITAALGNITRAKEMTQLTRETGITCDGLYPRRFRLLEIRRSIRCKR